MRCALLTLPSIVLAVLFGSCAPGWPLEPVERVDCESPIDGITWSENLPPESMAFGESDLQDELWSALPDPIDISAIDEIDRGLISYTLEIPPAELGSSLSHEAALQRGVLGRVVLSSIARSAESNWIDLDFFRRGFQRYYTCSKGFPLTLDGFRRAYFNYDEAEGTTVDSAAKCTQRRLMTDIDSGVRVSQTLVDGHVEETEIIFESLRSDGQLDFVVYGADERITDRSYFPDLGGGQTVMGSPYSCMSCHFTIQDEVWSYDLLFPNTGICRDH